METKFEYAKKKKKSKSSITSNHMHPIRRGSHISPLIYVFTSIYIYINFYVHIRRGDHAYSKHVTLSSHKATYLAR